MKKTPKNHFWNIALFTRFNLLIIKKSFLRPNIFDIKYFKTMNIFGPYIDTGSDRHPWLRRGRHGKLGPDHLPRDLAALQVNTGLWLVGRCEYWPVIGWLVWILACDWLAGANTDLWLAPPQPGQVLVQVAAVGGHRGGARARPPVVREPGECVGGWRLVIRASNQDSRRFQNQRS